MAKKGKRSRRNRSRNIRSRNIRSRRNRSRRNRSRKMRSRKVRHQFGGQLGGDKRCNGLFIKDGRRGWKMKDGTIIKCNEASSAARALTPTPEAIRRRADRAKKLEEIRPKDRSRSRGRRRSRSRSRSRGRRRSRSSKGEDVKKSLVATPQARQFK